MRALVAGSLLVLLASGGVADDPDAKAEAASLVDLAKPQVARGGYFDAVSNLKKAVAADPTNEDAALLLAGAYRDTGEYEKAVAVLASFDKSAAAQTLRAEVLFVLGRDADADAGAKAALAIEPMALGALVVVGRVQENAGLRDAAVETYKDVNSRWAKGEDAKETDDVLLAVARARLRLFRISNEYAKNLDGVVSRLEPVLKRSPDRVDAMVECGDLYLAGYRDVEAKKWYGKALEKNPHYAPALFGKARQMAFRYEDVDAAKLCEEQVLKENPAYVPALLFLAQQALGDGDFKKADPLIQRALAVDPADAEIRATRAAAAYLRDDKAAFEAETKEVLAKDKFAGVAYSVVAGALEEQRRFAEALVFAEKAVAVDPMDWDSHFLAGRNALNVGDDAKGEKYLQIAEKSDAFANIYRHNFIELFNAMRSFAIKKDARFVVRMPPEEEEAYFRLLHKAMSDSLDLLEKKWSFETEKPLFISEFAKQEDFATRTIGLPGFPALGACFGRVVTLDSPRALPPGAFGWKLTEHHELAHVITLQLSKGRVPRWLTEGLSVYEERKMGFVWRRDYDRDLVDAIASDDVLPLKDINNAFRGPRVLFAYYQGGLMSELIERDFGFDKLREMVRLYGEGLETDEVVRKALGVEPEEFDRRFLAYAKDIVKDLKVLRRPTKQKIDKLKRALRKTPEDFEGWFLCVEGALAQGDNPAALSALDKASKLRPDDARVPAMRALIAWRERKPALAVKHAEEALAKGADLYELRMGLAEFYSQPEKDLEKAVANLAKAKEHWRRAAELFPVQMGGGDPRLLLAKTLTAEGEKNLDEVMKLMRAHVDFDEDDVGTRKELATMYAQHGKPDDELLMLEQLRDIVPLPNSVMRPAGGEGTKKDDKKDAPERKAVGWTRADAGGLHERLAEHYMDRKRYADAELAWACAVGAARMDLGPNGEPPLEPTALAGLVVAHGESLRLLGRAEEARARAEEALRLDPANEDAKKLKDDLTR
jgi:tetratricopeptide (TPR) repeat protein